ncbi:hypothetical protein ACLB2K_032772 [Fragaria x ananassa]
MARNIGDAFSVETLPLNIRRHNYQIHPSSLVINFNCPTKRRWYQIVRNKLAAPRAHILESIDVAVGATSEDAKQQAAVTLELTAVVTVKRKNVIKLNTIKDMMLRRLGNHVSPNGHADHHNHKGVVLRQVSTQIHTKEMKPKLGREAILDWTKSLNMHAGKTSTTYQVKFVVDSNFGMPGAIMVSNRDENEFYLNSINIEGAIHFACNSWVQPKRENPAKRIFFSTNKAYLPSETPAGLKELREMELIQLRGVMEQDSENHLTEYTTMTLTMTLEIQIWEPDTKGQSLEATNTHTQDAVELEDLKPGQMRIWSHQ